MNKLFTSSIIITLLNLAGSSTQINAMDRKLLPSIKDLINDREISSPVLAPLRFHVSFYENRQKFPNEMDDLHEMDDLRLAPIQEFMPQNIYGQQSQSAYSSPLSQALRLQTILPWAQQGATFSTYPPQRKGREKIMGELSPSTPDSGSKKQPKISCFSSNQPLSPATPLYPAIEDERPIEWVIYDKQGKKPPVGSNTKWHTFSLKVEKEGSGSSSPKGKKRVHEVTGLSKDGNSSPNKKSR